MAAVTIHRDVEPEKIKLFSVSIFPPFYLSSSNGTGVFPSGSPERSLPTTEVQETWVQSLSQADPLKEAMATHSSILAWRIPWTEKPAGLQSTGGKELGMTELTELHTHNGMP